MDPSDLLERSQWDFFWVPSDAEILDRPDVAAVRHARAVPHSAQDGSRGPAS